MAGGNKKNFFLKNIFMKKKIFFSTTKYNYLATHIKIHKKKETLLFSNFRNILIKNLEKFNYLFFIFYLENQQQQKDKRTYESPDPKENKGYYQISL